jgi:hypothetical protein
MFETLKNPFIFAAAILGGLAVLALICKCFITIWRIIFIKPGKRGDRFEHYSNYQLREKSDFEKSRYQ